MKKKPISKKTKIILAILIVLIIALGAAIFLFPGRGRKVENTVSYQSSQAATGDIRSTISAVGNLENGEEKEIYAPMDIKVLKVNVESGDKVKKGQILATLDKASIAGLLQDAKDKKEDIEDDIDDADTSLEKEALEGELDEVEEKISMLQSFYDNPVIKAACAGIVGDVNVTAGEKIGTVSYNTGSTASSGSAFSVADLISLDVSAMENEEGSSSEQEGDPSKEEEDPTEKEKDPSGEGSSESTTEKKEDTTAEKKEDTTTAKKKDTDSSKKNTNKNNNNNNNKAGNNTSGFNKSAMSKGSMPSASAGTSAAYAASVTTTSGNSTSDSDWKTVVFTIQLQDQMKLSVSVDEMDILSVSQGMDAEITVDAVSDETFTGTISKVSYEPTSGSSSTKYPVTIVMDKNEKLLNGMSASASIVTQEVKDVLLIPVTALQEENGETFVYTQAGEDGTLSGKVTVTTGASDSNYVEIKEGLAKGDTVYYLKTDSESKQDGFMNMMGGPGGFGGGSGERPSFNPGSGGNPPSGFSPGSGKMPGGGGGR